MKWKWILCALLAFALLAGCGKEEDPAPLQEEPGAMEPVTAGNAQELLDKLTTEQKVAQLFFVRPDALDLSLTAEAREDPQADGLTQASAEALDTLRKYPVGGFVFFGKNLENPAQLAALMEELGENSPVPPLFATDEEGGSVARVANSDGFEVPQVGSMAQIGATGDPAQARQAAVTMGTYLQELGFHLDLAPVADVNSDPNNTTMADRAFHSNAEQAAMMVSAAVDGFHTAGVGCALKHFPGQGAASQDTHTGTAVTLKTWQEMLTCEIYPFQAGMASGADCVMVSHITTPNAVQQGDLPASLNPEMVTGKLRSELRFARVILTDSLSMAAITDTYEAGQAAMMAFQAGADILLMPEDLPAAYETILTAVEEGTISQQRLDESVLRILQLKEKYDLI